MVSLRSLRNFLIVNLFILTVSYLCRPGPGAGIFASVASEVIKGLVMVLVLDFVADKPLLHSDDKQSAMQRGLVAQLIDLCSISAMKGLAHSIFRTQAVHEANAGAAWNPVLFLIKSFVAEVVFDFGHYWMHRAAHANPAVYRWVHKKHHLYPHPRALTTFCMDPLDITLTYCVPMTAALYLVPLSREDFELFATYMLFQEVGGHLGKRMAPGTSSFVQCVWLPRHLGIQLYTEDHDLHHSNVRCNFSKRFSLWDKVFGTFSRPESEV